MSQGAGRWTNGAILPKLSTLFDAQPTWQPRNGKPPSPGQSGVVPSQPYLFHQHIPICTRSRLERAIPIKHAPLLHMSVLELCGLQVVDESVYRTRKCVLSLFPTQKETVEIIRSGAPLGLYDIASIAGRETIISAEHRANVHVKEKKSVPSLVPLLENINIENSSVSPCVDVRTWVLLTTPSALCRI